MPRTAAPVAQRFWSKVDVGESDACWLWRTGTFDSGYGQFGKQVNGKWKTLLAHKVAYELVRGPVPAGMLVCHTCDVKLCCNPKHHFLGTHADNVADMVAKGRQARGERSWAHRNPHLMPRGDRHGSRTHPEKILRGEDNPRARLRGSDVVAIRQLREAGRTYKEIGAFYSITPQAAFRIVKRLCWKAVS